MATQMTPAWPGIAYTGRTYPGVESVVYRDLHVSLGVPTFAWIAETNIRLWNAGPTQPFLWAALAQPFQWEATTPGYRDWTATLTQFEWNAAAEQFKWTAAPPNFD